jgi:hypothetical protein
LGFHDLQADKQNSHKKFPKPPDMAPAQTDHQLASVRTMRNPGNVRVSLGIDYYRIRVSGEGVEMNWDRFLCFITALIGCFMLGRHFHSILVGLGVFELYVAISLQIWEEPND